MSDRPRRTSLPAVCNHSWTHDLCHPASSRRRPCLAAAFPQKGQSNSSCVSWHGALAMSKVKTLKPRLTLIEPSTVNPCKLPTLKPPTPQRLNPEAFLGVAPLLEVACRALFRREEGVPLRMQASGHTPILFRLLIPNKHQRSVRPKVLEWPEVVIAREEHLIQVSQSAMEDAQKGHHGWPAATNHPDFEPRRHGLHCLVATRRANSTVATCVMATYNGTCTDKLVWQGPPFKQYSRGAAQQDFVPSWQLALAELHQLSQHISMKAAKLPPRLP